MPVETKQRTPTQNRAAHLWFKHISDTFNDHGLDMQTVLQQRVGIRWTEESVKEALFKVLARAMYQKDSTTKLSSKEFTQVAEMLADVIARDYGIQVEFPSMQTLMENQDDSRNNK